jgi:prevent-host-death family protein
MSALPEAGEMVILNGQMKTIPVTEFKARCLALLDDVARTGRPLVITKRGKPLARVVKDHGAAAVYPQHTLFGTVKTVGDIVSPVLPLSAYDAARGVLLHTSRRTKTKKKRRR